MHCYLEIIMHLDPEVHWLFNLCDSKLACIFKL